MKMPDSSLVSVIMPVHNGARFLRESLESALAQTHEPVEVIVVDDGSTDDTPMILREYGSRIKSIRQENGGAAAARNAAIKAAQGEFLAFLDADDLWTKEKLRVQVEYLRSRPHVDLVASHWQVLTPGAPVELDHSDPLQIGPRTDQRPEWIYNELLMDCVVHTTTVVMRRCLVDKIGLFDVALRRGQDYDYWLRASRVTPIHRLEARLSVYRQHEGNSIRVPQPINYAALVIGRALKRWGRVGPDGRRTGMVRMRRRMAEHWHTFGYMHAQAGSLWIAFQAAIKSLCFWPFQMKAVRLLAACAVSPIRRRGAAAAGQAPA